MNKQLEDLKNFIKNYDEVNANYYEKKDNEFAVVFYQDSFSNFVIEKTFTLKELEDAKRHWDFVEDWSQYFDEDDYVAAKKNIRF